MKAIAASNIVQFENAVLAVDDYYQTVKLGLRAYFFGQPLPAAQLLGPETKGKVAGAIVFGADQGFVGQFNEAIADHAMKTLSAFKGDHIIWSVGERVREYLLDAGFEVHRLFEVPHTVEVITPLVGDLLLESETSRSRNEFGDLYIFYNQHVPETIYKPCHERLLPLDQVWLQSIYAMPWPTKCLPEVKGESEQILLSLIHEYLFVSVYRACARSLATENACRLMATQRADEKIGEILTELKSNTQEMRQDLIDAELFDVVADFETLMQNKP